ncbi:DUF6428 family protein [Siphonobacter sp. SORGH_AS_0500]|uniref:DUF6428 family protein n=1 Tax=Siphonobacter sp. SORGH_AS_0500 TaxID=1864824 RepID=UPI0028548B39|nr:DUF6428 family protein [Siphonobacter sp. SORGH_AS_0500]MDR6198068.1 hypothetical protein [Siphonobacter sp. SORGH_AS_0500]
MANQISPMIWQAFKSTLEANPDLHLAFEYQPGQHVDASFHITEIKQAPIISVDCGGKMNSWTEVIVQLWEPPVREAERSMRVSKALEIINLVEKSLPLNPLAVVKIEFGNARFDTRQLYPGEFSTSSEDFIVHLVPDYTQCKALSRNEACGITASDSACCAPVAEKTALEIVAEGATCTPGSLGC